MTICGSIPTPWRLRENFMITQHYKLKASLDNLENARPGNFVFGSNDTDCVIGFIDFVSDTDVAIMLFEPMEITYDIGAINIAESCDCSARLREILEDDHEIATMWEAAFN